MITLLAVALTTASFGAAPGGVELHGQSAQYGLPGRDIQPLAQRSYAPSPPWSYAPAPIGSGILLPDEPAIVTIEGQVARPGPYVYSPGMTLSVIVGSAGMFVNGASYDEILVLRPVPNGNSRTHILSWNIVWHRNVELAPGDIVIVPDRSLVPL